MRKLRSLLALALGLAPALLRAELKLPAIIGDHMVLQQKQANPIWGWDTPGTKVTVTFAGQTHAATAGADGRFTLELQGFGAGWMDESWLLRVRRNGYENIEQEIQLPGSTDGRLLLVGMHRGRSAPFREPESSKGLMEETKQWYPGLGSGISGSP